MKILTSLAAAVLAVSATGVILAPSVSAGPTYTGQESNIAVSGYDVVSYFQGSGVPVKGAAQFSADYEGATYMFSSAANAEKFKQNPAAFAPQYGGHCAWAMSRGSLAPGDATKYKVVDGKLYLNFNADVQNIWLSDIPGFIAKADQQWPAIPDDAKFGG